LLEFFIHGEQATAALACIKPRPIDMTRVVMHRFSMKTITLTDEAYARLKSWKVDSADSFSKVVLRSVPKRGTAGDMNDAFAMLPALTGRQSAALQASLAWANDWKNYPADTPTGVLRKPKPRR